MTYAPETRIGKLDDCHNRNRTKQFKMPELKYVRLHLKGIKV